MNLETPAANLETRNAPQHTVEGGCANPATDPPAVPALPAPRYHALDCVRAAAMFLGLFYHLQFMNAGGFGFFGMPGFGMTPPFNPKGTIDAWLHSFRMPLFFLISGFFANMMLAKYGIWTYLARRWWRIGAPLLVAFIGFGVLRTYFPKVTSAAFGGMAFATADAPGPAPAGRNTTFGPFGGNAKATPPGGGATQSAPGPFGPFGPTGQFGTNRFGGGNPMGQGNPFGGPMPGQFGPPGQFGAPGQPPFGMPPFTAPARPSHAWLDAIFKQVNRVQGWVFEKAPWIGTALTAIGGQKGRLAAGNFSLEHLWFLWYLLVFVTVAPLLLVPLGRLLKKPAPFLDRIGRWLLRFNLAAPILGLLLLPAVLHARGADWTVENPAGFFATLPDCLVQYYSDLPFYFLYFVAGWGFFCLRDAMPVVAKYWLWNLVLGITAFAISRSLYRDHGMQTTAPYYAQYRLAAFALYAVGGVCSGMGLLGLFQRYLDRPTQGGKYFTDTILWIYLVQLAIIPHIMPWIQGERTAWWEASIAGMVVVSAVALVMFELFIRPTPLVHIFGPASLAGPQRPCCARQSQRD